MSERQKMQKFDLHIHSNMSDGTYDPEAIPALAKQQGVNYISLTDHDTTAGCEAAINAGREIGVTVIHGIELDVEFSAELHILGLNVDPKSGAMAQFEAWRGECRRKRNGAILDKLERSGIHAERYIEHSRGNDTRLHIAKALVSGGYAESVRDAFKKYLNEGGIAFVPGLRPSKKEAIELILHSGGKPVLAHPCQIKADVNKLARELADYGLWGMEAFYPSSTAGQRSGFVSIAAQLGLCVTCGSDFHGKNRETVIGCAYEETPLLEQAWREFFGEKRV